MSRKVSLDGKVVLLTGASRGLGVDMARAFGRRGARLALAARSRPELEGVREELEQEAITVAVVPADVSELASLERLLVATEEGLGPVDVLVNNAGIEQVYDFEAMSAEEIAAIIQVNVVGLAWLTRLVVPGMIERGRGHIVNIASLAGVVGVPHNAVYAASKHAVVGLSRSLRLELREHGIGVSVVCPGFVQGGMFLRHGRKPPALAGWVTSEAVARATVSAVVSDRGEVIVSKGLGRIGDWFQAMTPELGGRIMRWGGVEGFLREVARENVEQAGAGPSADKH
jgi:short-subunit dehydrogenase